MSDSHRRLQDLFHQALELDATEREGLVDRLEAEESELGAKLRGLLQADDNGPPLTSLRSEVPVDELLDGSKAIEPATSAPECIGDYRIVREVGRGGMGIVYEAVQENPRRRVALKVVNQRLTSPDVRRRFEYEGQILGLLQHPGIGQIHAAHPADDDGYAYFAMEYVEGRPLLDHVRGAVLDRAERLQLFVRICAAIHHAHQKGIIHRDLKPSNILVTPDGQPKILDFGIARTVEADDAWMTLQTGTGQLVGTLAYMSPEQTERQGRELDTRSDIYTLGVVLYEMLTGRTPHDLGQKTLFEALRVIREETPVALGTRDRELQGDLETIVSMALAKEPDRRYDSAASLAADVERYLADEPIAARPPSTIYLIRKFTRRNRLLVGGLATLVVILCAATTVSVALMIEARTEATKALRTAKFVQRMFRSASPYETKGPDYTVRELLDEFTADTAAELAGEPEIEASLAGTVGMAYLYLDVLDKSLEHHRRALELVVELEGPEAERAYVLRNSIAIILKKQGKHREAEAMYREVISGFTRLRGPEDYQTLRSKSNLGGLLVHDGRPDEARAVLEEIAGLPVFREERLEMRVFSSVHVNLGAAYHGLDRFADAERHIRRAIEIQEEFRPPDHPMLLEQYSNLATAFLELGDLDKARPHLEHAYAGQLRTLGQKHVDLLDSQEKLAELAYRQGRWSDAAELFAKWRDTPGRHQRHSLFREVTAWLGRCYLEIEDFARAEPLLKQSYARAIRKEGPRGERTRLARSRLQTLFERTGRKDIAASLEPVAPAPPKPVSPAEPPDGSMQLILAASPFEHGAAAVKHIFSHWQLRRAGDDYDSDPTLDVVSAEHLDRLPIPPGLLLDGEIYSWRVRYVGSNRFPSPFGAEGTIAGGTPRAALRRIDLDKWFQRDLVGHPGETATDSIDGDHGSSLTIDDPGDADALAPAIRGLPRDRIVGVHRLGAYDGPNAIQIIPTDEAPIRLEASPGRYRLLRVLVVGANGESSLPVRLEYASGEAGAARLIAPDWFDEAQPRRGVSVTAVRNGMDRLVEGKLHDANDPALFECLIAPDPRRELRALTLDVAGAKFASDRSTINLFALTGVIASGS